MSNRLVTNCATSRTAVAGLAFVPFWQGRFIKNLATVMAGTLAAQALNLAVVPVLSRLYTPADFGVFGSFTAVLAVLTAAATLQFAQAVVLPRDEDDAARLFLLSCLATVGLAGLCLIVCCLRADAVLGLFMLPGRTWLLWLLPVAVLAVGFNQALLAWSVRGKTFRWNAASQVVRAGVAGGLQLLLGMIGSAASGLVGGAIAGETASGASLYGVVSTSDRRRFRANASWRKLVNTAREYRDFPLYATPQNLINAASQGIPVVLLAYYFGAAAAGCYAVAMRLLQAPVNLVLNALRQVLLQKATEAHNQGQPLMPIFRKITAGLAAVMAVPAAVGFIFAPWLFAQALGAKWAEAGQYARWLIPWLALSFCNVPAVLFGRILRQQRNLLIYDLLLLILRTGALVAGGMLLSPIQTVALFSLVGSAFNLGIVIWVGFRVAGRDRELAKIR